jgi:hypothetical protein
MIRDFLALPNPLRYVLSRLAKIQHFSTIDLVSKMENVNYFEEVSKVDDEFFCEDGVHPSARGYDLWSEAMVESFLQNLTERHHLNGNECDDTKTKVISYRVKINP